MPSNKKKFSSEEVEGWDKEDVARWLISVKLDAFRNDFESQDVTGRKLLQITSGDIKTMNCTDKRKKAMKKALSSLPGNSASSKSKAKKTRKQSAKSASSAAPPPHKDGPPLPPSQGSSRGPHLREPLPPAPVPGEEYYEDPVLSMEAEAGGNHQEGQWGGVGSGSLPEDEGYGDPTDIYDCVDEMDVEQHPPPLGLPPQGNGFQAPPPSYPPGQEFEDQAIYEEGEEQQEPGSFDDSFSSENEESDDDYLSPFEEDPPLEGASRADSDAIRKLKGKFYAHGLTEHTGISITSSNNSSGSPKGGARGVEQPMDGDEFDDDIYDCVPEELKGEILDDDPEEPDEIYDVPQEMAEAAAPPVALPPKPKQFAPPPTSAPPPDYGEGEDDIYDEGAEADMEEVYDNPSEMDRIGKAPAPPPPPPPASPPPPDRSPSPFDEDIYDTADLDQVPASPPPGRPPKSPNVNLVSRGPPIFRNNKPSQSPAASPSFHKNRAPLATPPPSPVSPVVPLPPRPPKSDSFKPPPLPPSESHPPPAETHPPPPPLANDSGFKCPPLRTPISDMGAGEPPPRPSIEKKPLPPKEPPKITEERFSPASNKRALPPRSNSPMMDRRNLKPVDASKKGSTSPPLPPSLPPSEPKHNKHVPNSNGIKKTGFNGTTTTKPPPSRTGSSQQKLTSSSLNKPMSKITRISNLMNRFENRTGESGSEGSEGSAASSLGPSPITSPNHKLAGPTKPIPDVSPLSGRKMGRKTSVDDLTKKFGGRTRSPSPDIKPSLPPKSPGIVHKRDHPSSSLAKPAEAQPPNKPWVKKSTPAQDEEDEPPNVPPPPKPWMVKKPAGKVATPPSSRPAWKKKTVETPEDKDEPPNVPPPAKPWMKKPMGKPAGEDQPPTTAPPAKSWMKKPLGKPEEDKPPTTALPAKSWMKKPLGKPSEEDQPPTTAPPAKPWMKKPLSKPVDQDQPPTTTPPAKPWMKKPSEEDQPPTTAPPAKPWMKKPLGKPAKPAISSSPPPRPGALRNKPMPQPADDHHDSSPEEIEEEPPPPRLPPQSWKKEPSESSSSPGIGKKAPPPLPADEGSGSPTKKTFTYKPYNPKEQSSVTSSRVQPNSAVPVPELRLPSRTSESANEALSLPGRAPPPSYRAPPEPELPSRNMPAAQRPPLDPPSLPGRLPPPRPPPEPENDSLPPSLPPSLPGRSFPSPARVPEPHEDSVPSLPTRNPPTHRPSDPPLPPRPGGQPVSDPALPTLPDRSRRGGNTSKPPHHPPSDLPGARPPNLPSKRTPEPLPSEPSLPSRVPKSAPPGPPAGSSPAGQVWYHSKMNRKDAENLLRLQNKDGTFIIRDSTKIAGEYSLSLWFGGGVRHLRIRLKPDKRFVLGEEKSDEHAFETVMELVARHRHEPIHLKSGGETTLKYECPH